MKLSILFKTLALLVFTLSSTVSNIPLQVTANTPANSPNNTQQLKRFKSTLSGHTEPVRALSLSSDGKILASGGDKTIKLWNLSTNTLLHNLTGHRDRIKSIIITPDGQTVISSSFDNTIKFWNIQSGKEIRTITEKAGVNGMVLTPDGQTLISGSSDRTIKFRNLKTKKIDRILKTNTTALAISRDGKTLFRGC